MMNRVQRWGFSWGMACLLGAGCATATRPTPARAPAAAAAPPAEAIIQEVESSPTAEKRIQAYAHYAAGVLFQLNDDPEKALSEFAASAAADPGHESLAIEVARQYLQRRQAAKARDLLLTAAARPGANGAVDAWLGVAYAELGQNELAVRANRQALKKSPRLVQAYQNLVQLYLKLGRPKDAVHCLEEASRQSTAPGLFLIELVDILLINRIQLETPQAPITPLASQMLDRAAQLTNAANPAVLQRLADSYNLTGQFRKAADIYLDLLRRYPSLPGIRSKLTTAFLQADDKKAALEQLELLVRDNPTKPQGYLLLAGLAIETKEYERAAEFLKKALLLDPSLEAAYYELAQLQITLNQAAAALTTLGEARTRFDRNFLVEFFSALAHARLKAYPESLKCFTAAEVVAQATDPKRLNHVFYFHLAATLERSRDYAQAERYFRRCLELQPDYAEGLNYLGYMWADRKVHLDEARVMIEKALKLEPDNAAFLDSLGWVFFRLGQIKEALTCLEKAIARSAEPDPTLYDHLGEVLAALRKTAPAREAWRKSLALEANPEIEKKLKALGDPELDRR